MTEKRFYLDENGINDREYEFSVLGEDELVDIINELAEEKEILVDVVKKANDLISRFGSDELKHQWKKAVTIEYR